MNLRCQCLSATGPSLRWGVVFILMLPCGHVMVFATHSLLTYKYGHGHWYTFCYFQYNTLKLVLIVTINSPDLIISVIPRLHLRRGIFYFSIRSKQWMYEPLTPRKMSYNAPSKKRWYWHGHLTRGDCLINCFLTQVNIWGGCWVGVSWQVYCIRESTVFEWQNSKRNLLTPSFF